MVELLIYPNPRIDQTLLFDGVKRYNTTKHKPVNMRILESRIKTSIVDDDKDILELFLEIRHNQFYCKAYGMEAGKVDKSQTVRVKASWETVPVYYELVKDGRDNYRVESDDKLYYLLNYALQQRGLVMRGNKQGFKSVSYLQIINSLNNLNFGALIKEMYGQTVLMPTEWEEIPVNG